MARSNGITESQEIAIERGHRARAARLETADFAREQQATILAALISGYRSKALTYEFLLGKVGELVAIQDLIARLEGFETQGYTAKERSHGT